MKIPGSLRNPINRELTALMQAADGRLFRLCILNAKGETVHVSNNLVLPPYFEPGSYVVRVDSLDAKGVVLADSVILHRELEIPDEEPDDEEETPPAVPVTGDPVSSVIALLSEDTRELRAEMRAMREAADAERKALVTTQLEAIKANADERVRQSHELHLQNLRIVQAQVRAGRGVPAVVEDEPESGIAEIVRELAPIVKEYLPQILTLLAARNGAGGTPPE